MKKQRQVHVDHMQRYSFTNITRAMILQSIANEESGSYKFEENS